MTNTLKFTPQTLTVHVGDTVVWKNGSALTHTVTDVLKPASTAGDATLPKGAKPFNSGYLNPGQSYSHMFAVSGTYHYFCIPHEATGMVGVVIVKPARHSALRGIATLPSGREQASTHRFTGQPDTKLARQVVCGGPCTAVPGLSPGTRCACLRGRGFVA